MFTHILVPLDGSKLAEQALPVAARVARASAAHVVLVRAIVAPVTFGFMYEGESLRWKLMQDETEAAQTYLDEIARSPLLSGLAVDKVVKVGAAADVILDVVAARGVDLVALTSHGRTGIGRWVLGSVANHVAHQSIAPVLILHGPSGGNANTGGISSERPTRILVPLDGSPLAEAALEPARALALALGVPEHASIHLMLVVAPYEAEPENMPEALIMDGAKAYLERVAQRLRAESQAQGPLTVTWSVKAGLDVAQAILSAAETGEGVNAAPPSGTGSGMLIAIATHGQGGIARWAMGSVTDRILHTTKLPLLIVRPRDTAAQPRS